MLSLKHRLIAIVAALLVVCAWGCESGDDAEESEATEEVEDEESEEDDEETSEADDESADVDEDSDDDGDSDGKDADEDAQEDDDSDDEEGDDEEDDDETEEDSEEDEEALDFDPTELPVYATGPVAVVNGEVISEDDFNAVAAQQLGMMPPETIEAQGLQMTQVRDMILEGLVASVLITNEIEDRGITISDAEIDEAIEEFEAMMAQQFGGEAQLAAMLEEQGVDEDLMRQQVEQELAAERLLDQGDSGSVTDAQVRQYYEQNKHHFHTEEMTRARHILLNVDGDNGEEMRQKAEELAQELQADDSRFAELAAEHSDCPSAEQGGDLGYFTREMLMPEFTEAAFSMSPGDVSQPVRSNLGWHVILVKDRRDEGEASFEEVRDELRMMLEAQNMEQTAMELIQGLMEKADVVLRQENIVVDG